MITILAYASNQNALRDLIRSLIGNAEKKDSFQIFVGGDTSKDELWLETMSEFKDQASLFLMSEGQSKEIDTQLCWVLSDEVFILGSHWDKRINYYKEKYPDDIIVMFPTGYKPYGVKSEAEIAAMAERHPVLSAKWVELVGLQDAEMICRQLFLKHGIDRRIDIRLIDIQERGAPSPRPGYDPREVARKADIIADYINNFTQSRT